jgi:uncharacterized protein
MKSLIKKYPVLAYFLLTFLISWSGVITLAFFTGIPATSTQSETIGTIAYLPFLLGPSIAGLVLTSMTTGTNGFTTLFSQLIKWKVNFRWYLFALILVPVFAGCILFVLSQFSDVYLPDIITKENKLNLIITALLTGIFGVLFEDIGWTGFAIPNLLNWYSVFTTGLIVGGLWGLWHFLPVYWGCGDSAGVLDKQQFFPGFFFHYVGLIPFRILLVWLYYQTKSILLPWLMHTTLTVGPFFIFNISQTGQPLFVYYSMLALSFWIIVGIVMVNINTK